jgi:2-haloalkanoic acid dehalogenase type II
VASQAARVLLAALPDASHVDFWRLTGDALDHALEALRLDGGRLRGPLLDAYERLATYPEVPGMLGALRAGGTRAAVLSNGSPDMLGRGLAAAGLGGLLDPVISVEERGRLQADARVYLLATRALGLRRRVAFFSSNGWDAHGAASFGFRAVWVNRPGSRPSGCRASRPPVVPTSRRRRWSVSARRQAVSAERRLPRRWADDGRSRHRDVEAAALRLAGVAVRTPLVESEAPERAGRRPPAPEGGAATADRLVQAARRLQRDRGHAA